MTASSTLLTAGVVCMIAAIVGGGLKAFGIEMPALASVRRQIMLGILGVALAIAALVVSKADGANSGQTDANSLSTNAVPPAAPTERNEVVANQIADISSNTPAPATEETNPDALQANSGFIYLGMRAGNGWAYNQYAHGRVINSDAIPQPGEIRMIVQPVNLRAGLPAEAAPLTMRASRGSLLPGARVRIKTVTLIQNYYWASVEVITVGRE